MLIFNAILFFALRGSLQCQAVMPNSLVQSPNSPEGDVICTSLTSCRPWDENAWQDETNSCSRSTVFQGPRRNITVYDDEFLDGGGASMAEGFVRLVSKYRESRGGQDRRGNDRPPFNRAFEWCTGPGYIAFATLAAGHVSSLLLSDINPRAVRCLHKTVAENGLEDVVSVHLGKDFLHLPHPADDAERIDLVLANPPNYMNIDSHATDMVHDLRPADPSWQTHDAFYKGVGQYLGKDAMLFIEEVLPESCQVANDLVGLPSHPGSYDSRPDVPLTVFKRMARQNDLRYLGLEDLDSLSKLLVFEPEKKSSGPSNFLAGVVAYPD